MEVVHTALYTIGFLYLLTNAGNAACKQMFIATGLKPDADGSAPLPDLRAGWVIGTLERLILAVGILTHSWEVLAAVIALKTVARFKELDNKQFSEYFLAGSLFSILWAVCVTAAWVLYDREFGTGTLDILTAALEGTVAAPALPTPASPSP